MRLSQRIRNIIQTAISKSFGDAQVYLFGSRTDDAKKGGDIDLAIAIDLPIDEFKKKKINFLASLARLNFEIKVDIVHYTTKDALLFSEIQKNNIRLM